MVVRIVGSGQSNCIGRGKGGPSFSGLSSRVRVWNNENPLGADGTAFVVPTEASPTFDPNGANNLGVWFCNSLALLLNDDIRYTMIARGGSGIGSWTPGASTGMLQEMIDVWGATAQPPADIFIWHQGEANDEQDFAYYNPRWVGLVSDLTNAGVINASTIIIVGGLCQDTPARINFNNTVLKQLAANDPRLFYADSDGLTSYDGTHFTGQSLYTHGASRYMQAYLQAKGLNMTDFWALINQGGTPGVPGSGDNRLYNLINLVNLGMQVKNTGNPATFTGVPPSNMLLTPEMIAAGAIVDWGIDAVNGIWARWENGFQVCAGNITLSFNNSSDLRGTWTYGKRFNVTNPFVIASPSNWSAINGTAPISTAKQANSLPDVLSAVQQSATIRLASNAQYVSGDTFGARCFAIGQWK